jgi:hypothetical protein
VFTLKPIDPEGRIKKRLRPLRLVCGVLAAAVAVYAVSSWVLLEGLAMRPFPAVPDAVPVTLTVLAMMLILLSSRLRTNLLRKGLPSGMGFPIDLDRLLGAYRMATVVSFLLLEAAALFGLLVALLTGTAFYGIFLGAASVAAMLTRWPRESDVEGIARGRRSA